MSYKMYGRDLYAGIEIKHFFTTQFGTHCIAGVVTEVSDPRKTRSGLEYVVVTLGVAKCIDQPDSDGLLYGYEGSRMPDFTFGLRLVDTVEVMDFDPPDGGNEAYRSSMGEGSVHDQ